jgi:hypothetical protein
MGRLNGHKGIIVGPDCGCNNKAGGRISCRQFTKTPAFRPLRYRRCTCGSSM